MRVITKEELPAGPLFVKLPATQWFEAKIEKTTSGLLVRALGTVFTPPHERNIFRDASKAGWLWNTSKQETGARQFYVAEEGDEESRKLVRSAGANQKSITITLKGGNVLQGKLADFPHTRYPLDFKLSTPTGIMQVSWFDVASVALTPEPSADKS
jgi:hypothetical protein